MARATDDRRLPRIARWVIALGVAVATAQFARTGVADFLRLEPCAYLDRLRASGKRADAGLLGAASGRLELARLIDTGNPVIEEYLAVVFVHRANLVAGDLPLRLAYLEKAAAHYAGAIALRRNSAYLWAGLATVRAALLRARTETGASAAVLADRRDGLRDAMRRAVALAGYEPEVLEAVVRASAALQPALGRDDFALLEEARRRLGVIRAAA